jgi:hypothetical protein
MGSYKNFSMLFFETLRILPQTANRKPQTPFVNWSKQHGDLRVAHFLGMHSLQVLPLMDRYISKRSMLTFFISIIYFLLVTALFYRRL